MTEASCTRLCRLRAAAPFPELDEYSTRLPCEYCSRFNYLERHHRLFRSHGGLWVPSNIVMLCQGCHAATTDEQLTGAGLNVRTGEVPAEVPVYIWYAGFVLLDDDGGYRKYPTPALTMADNGDMF